jgi:acetyl esterase/lipase
VPDANSYKGTQLALDAVQDLCEDDLVLFLISGGGFMQCSEEWAIEYMASEVSQLRKAGFAIASVQYRVGGEGVNIKQVYSDMADAMRYMSYYSDVFGIDPNKFITSGHSAGGSASLALAYIDHDIFDVDQYWPEADYLVAGAFAMSGHGDYTKTDFGPYGGYCSENARTNKGLFPTEEMRKEVSPVFCLEGSKVPCKLLMGEMDNVVAPVFVEKFEEACKAADVPCEVVWFENGGHTYESMNGEEVTPRVSAQKRQIVRFAKSCVEG